MKVNELVNIIAEETHNAILNKKFREYLEEYNRPGREPEGPGKKVGEPGSYREIPGLGKLQPKLSGAESSGFPNMKEWWTEDQDKVMTFVYWLQGQLPPTDPEKKAAAWESLKQQLEKKHPSPSGAQMQEGDEDVPEDIEGSEDETDAAKEQGMKSDVVRVAKFMFKNKQLGPALEKIRGNVEAAQLLGLLAQELRVDAGDISNVMAKVKKSLDEVATGMGLKQQIGSALEMLEAGNPQGAAEALYDVLENLESDDPQFNPLAEDYGSGAPGGGDDNPDYEGITTMIGRLDGIESAMAGTMSFRAVDPALKQQALEATAALHAVLSQIRKGIPSRK